MKLDLFEKRIDELRGKIEDALKSGEARGTDSNHDILELHASISTMLEELQVASEELRQQNEELHHTQVLAERDARRFAELFEGAPDAYLVTDLLGVILEANRAAVNLLNVPLLRIAGKPLVTFFRGEYLQDLLGRLRALKTEGAREKWDGQLHPRGLPPIDITINVAAQLDVTDRNLKLLWLIRDITATHELARGLYDSQARLRAIFESVDIGILLMDLHGKIMESNPAFQDMLGCSAEYLRSIPYLKLISPNGASEQKTLFTALISGARNRYEIEHEIGRKDGSRIWVRNIMSLLRDAQGNRQYALGLFENITAVRRRDEDVLQLERSIEESIDKERESLGRDLHDGPIQHQISILFRLQQLINKQTDTATVAELESLKKEIQQGIDMLRATTGMLRSPTLAHFGLETAIQSYVEQMQASNHGTAINLNLDHADWTLSKRVQQGVFRIFQNCLNNALRHAEASSVAVRLASMRDHLILEVVDNGKGFEVPRRWVDLTQGGHYGLVGSAERAASMGGIMQVRSQPGRGTMIRVTVPLKEEDQKKRTLTDLEPEILTSWGGGQIRIQK